MTGSGAEAGKVYITQGLQQLFVRAEEEVKRLRDDYMSVEHILLVMSDEKGIDSNWTAFHEISIKNGNDCCVH
ncbi:hypothetical protein GCM10020331_078940 [Ectobacillus funiculus]